MIRRVPIMPTLLVVAAVVTMIWLGIWQLGRAEWKADLLARYRQAETLSAEVPWPRDDVAAEDVLYRRSSFICDRVLERRTTAGTAASGRKGLAHIARCALDSGGEAEVELGWSYELDEPEWSGGEVSGIVAPGPRLVATPPQAGLAPLAPPDPADVPNNHLSYAGQWFFFALTAVAIYILALRKRWRDR